MHINVLFSGRSSNNTQQVACVNRAVELHIKEIDGFVECHTVFRRHLFVIPTDIESRHFGRFDFRRVFRQQIILHLELLVICKFGFQTFTDFRQFRLIFCIVLHLRQFADCLYNAVGRACNRHFLCGGIFSPRFIINASRTANKPDTAFARDFLSFFIRQEDAVVHFANTLIQRTLSDKVFVNRCEQLLELCEHRFIRFFRGFASLQVFSPSFGKAFLHVAIQRFGGLSLVVFRILIWIRYKPARFHYRIFIGDNGRHSVSPQFIIDTPDFFRFFRNQLINGFVSKITKPLVRFFYLRPDKFPYRLFVRFYVGIARHTFIRFTYKRRLRSFAFFTNQRSVSMTQPFRKVIESCALLQFASLDKVFDYAFIVYGLRAFLLRSQLRVFRQFFWNKQFRV